MKVELEETVANAILAFLGKCPYEQVAGLIQAIRQCKPIEEKPANNKEK
jgi:hypothetical protein